MTSPSEPEQVNPGQSPPEVPDDSAKNQPEVPKRLSFTSTAVLVTSLVLSIILLGASMWGWYAIGYSIRSRITWPQAATLLFFVFVMLAIMLSLGYSRLWADEDGVTIRNGPVLRKFRVDQIAGLRLRPGDAWAYLLIKDGKGGVRRRAVLAIQQLEGEGAQRKIRDLRNWLLANGASAEGTTYHEPDRPQ